MSVIIEEVVAETTARPGPESSRSSRNPAQAKKRQTAWIERRDLARCIEQIERRRDRLDAE